MKKIIIGCAALSSLVLTGCGNSVYGPRRLIYAGYIDGGHPLTDGGAAQACPNSSQTTDLTLNFTLRACTSIANPGDVNAAAMMMQAGITLNRMRCNDFFAQRAGNQGRSRIIKESVLPVSALLTGIISLKSFKSDNDRSRATQILGLGQTATIAGLELFQQEFLFGSANINSVRILTMRALDTHAGEIQRSNVGFDGAARHLIDHQMLCTPANILALAQDAIRGGQIEPATPVRSMMAPAVAQDQQVLKTLSSNLQVRALTADQLGALWWLVSLPSPRANASPDELEIIQERLSGLPFNLVQGARGSFTIDDVMVSNFSGALQKLSPDVTNGFVIAQALFRQKVAQPAPPSLLERTSPPYSPKVS